MEPVRRWPNFAPLPRRLLVYSAPRLQVGHFRDRPESVLGKSVAVLSNPSVFCYLQTGHLLKEQVVGSDRPTAIEAW